MLATLLPFVAGAETTFKPFASGAYEHDSNVFYLYDGATPLVGKHGMQRDDDMTRIVGGVNAEFDWSQQSLYANAEARRFDYNNFDTLNHTEALLNGGVNWKLASLVDGTLDYRHERRMVPFMDYQPTTALELETEDIGAASLNFQIGPIFRWENRGSVRNLDSPRLNAPLLNLRENELHEGFRYIGIADLSVGVDGDYLEGKFTHAPPPFTTIPYHQTAVMLAADYKLTGISSFNGDVGYSRRTDSVGGDVSAVTGALGYKRQITGKTSANLQLFRTMNSYVTTAGTELDSGVSLGAVWEATGKITVTPALQWMVSRFPGNQYNGSRSDHFRAASLDIEYAVLQWLTLHPYARYQFRSSSLQGFGFDANIVGIEIRVHLP
jgi:hypothetical protein